MDSENNFDSDTSESWSLIDLNCEQSSDINLTDEIGAEALETRLEEVENAENCSALPGDQEENGLPESIITSGNDDNFTSGNGHVKNRPDFQALYKGPIFEDECDVELYSGVVYGKSNLDEAEIVDPERKDVEDDTDGISVISESEFNEGKVNAYESDEIWDEKPSDSDANENPGSVNWKKERVPKVSYGESSEEGMNSDMAFEEDCCPKSTDVGKNENGMHRKQLVAPPVYRPYRNNRPGFLLRLTMGILLSGISYIILGYFCGDEDSLRTANNMAQTVRKLQKENLILHSRLTQLNRAVLARGVKLDLKEETEPACLKDEFDCRKINLKLYERNTDEGNYDPNHARNKNSLDFSIPLNHPKNVLAFKQILSGNEVVLARKSDETFEPFNFSKYMEALVSGHYTVGTPTVPFGMNGKSTKPVVLENEKRSEPKDEEPVEKQNPEDKNIQSDGSTSLEEKQQKPEDQNCRTHGSTSPDEEQEKPEDKNCQTDGLTSPDVETRKQNCLGIEEKDLSKFRWFILKDKPKCSGIKVEDLEELESECLYRIPMEKIFRTKNTDELEDSDAVTAKTDFLKGKDHLLKVTPSERIAALRFHTKSTNDRDKLKEKKPTEKNFRFKKTKKREINLGFPGRYFDYSDKSVKKKEKNENEKEKGKVDTGGVDKYLKYFAKVEKEIRENKGRMKECVVGKDGRCELKFKDPDENDQPHNENYKKNVEKRSKPDGERKNNKKDQPSKGKKDKTDLRSKKWKTCSIKSDLKCGNGSKCYDNCTCKSGDWFSRWAEGREKCRRDQKISDWQFDRAKSREYSRIGDAFWQFSRAYGRQNRRMYPYSRKKKVRHFSGKGPGSKPDSLK